MVSKRRRRDQGEKTPNTQPEPEYLTVKEAAALARMHYQTLYGLIHSGKVTELHGVCHVADGRHLLIDKAKFRRAFIEGTEGMAK